MVTLDDIIWKGYCFFMLRTFKCKETEKIFLGCFSKKLPRDIHKVVERKLIMLHHAMTITDLLIPPANRLETLIGKRLGQHSIRINRQWRICFAWQSDGVYDVEIVDYH